MISKKNYDVKYAMLSQKIWIVSLDYYKTSNDCDNINLIVIIIVCKVYNRCVSIFMYSIKVI